MGFGKEGRIGIEAARGRNIIVEEDIAWVIVPDARALGPNAGGPEREFT
jgi:hypothetical protein